MRVYRYLKGKSLWPSNFVSLQVSGCWFEKNTFSHFIVVVEKEYGTWLVLIINPWALKVLKERLCYHLPVELCKEFLRFEGSVLCLCPCEIDTVG